MKEFYVEKVSKLKKAIPQIENKLKVRMSLVKSKVTIKGNEVVEFVVGEIIRAIDFGFEAEDALLLANEDFVLEFINIKEHTRRRNLEEVRSRVIGTDGKAKRTIEELTGGAIVINENMVGLIVGSEHLESAVQGIVLLIQGAKHGNVFSYLEKQNASLRKIDDQDLGLKNPEKDLALLDEDEIDED
jgi:ribosomal RNA assembly protein